MKKILLFSIFQFLAIYIYAWPGGYVFSSTEGVERDKGYGAEFKRCAGNHRPVSIFMDSTVHRMGAGYFAFIPAETTYAFSSSGENKSTGRISSFPEPA